jgi:hypothetical protein
MMKNIVYIFNIIQKTSHLKKYLTLALGSLGVSGSFVLLWAEGLALFSQQCQELTTFYRYADKMWTTLGGHEQSVEEVENIANTLLKKRKIFLKKMEKMQSRDFSKPPMR